MPNCKPNDRYAVAQLSITAGGGNEALFHFGVPADYVDQAGSLIAIYLVKGAQFRMWSLGGVTAAWQYSNAFNPYSLQWKYDNYPMNGYTYRVLSVKLNRNDSLTEPWTLQSYVAAPPSGRTTFCIEPVANVIVCALY